MSGRGCCRTAGSQQAFDLLARILVTPGRTVVALENPGYTAQRAAFVEAGAVHRGIPVDEEGLVVDRLPDGVDVIGVAPSHHFPGVTMSPGDAALRRCTCAPGGCHYEDDYDGEFRLGGRPLDAAADADREQRGSMSAPSPRACIPHCASASS
jgi:GntR family transcriptional regulator/MocR family aminotransferase